MRKFVNRFEAIWREILKFFTDNALTLEKCRKICYNTDVKMRESRFPDAKRTILRRIKMNNKYESMSFCIDDYNNVEEMWRDISNFMRILLKNRNLFTVRQEDEIVIVIEYQHNDCGEVYWGVAQPVWLDEDEKSYLETYEPIKKED